MHDDVIKWKHFPRNWPFVREIHRSPVNFPHKGQWRGALMFSLIYARINDWVNNREAGDLRRQHGHYDVIVKIPMHKTVSLSLSQAVWKKNERVLYNTYILDFIYQNCQICWIVRFDLPNFPMIFAATAPYSLNIPHVWELSTWSRHGMETVPVSLQ